MLHLEATSAQEVLSFEAWERFEESKAWDRFCEVVVVGKAGWGLGRIGDVQLNKEIAISKSYHFYCHRMSPKMGTVHYNFLFPHNTYGCWLSWYKIFVWPNLPFSLN